MDRSVFSRRAFALGALASSTMTTACGNGVGSTGGDTIDARVDVTLEDMYRQYPSTRNLADNANGMLVMPLVTEAGLWFGGAYGRGALRVGGVTVDYYSLIEASAGFFAGGQQYAHVLFFMTEPALTDFRKASGWAAGGDLEYVFSDQGEGARASTVTALSPVLAVIFNRAGLLAGATLQGNKYTRIIP